MDDWNDKTPTQRPNGHPGISDAAREIQNLALRVEAVAAGLRESGRDLDHLAGRDLVAALSRHADQARAVGGLGHDVGRAIEAIRDEIAEREGVTP